MKDRVVGFVWRLANGIASMLREFADFLVPLPGPPALTEPRPENPKRLDVRRFRVQENVILAVFWKDLPHGRGPAISLYIFQYEILRFDCFGGTEGHYHVASEYEQPRVGRIEFQEKAVTDQLERAHFELLNNTILWQSFHPDARVRTLEIDNAHLRHALGETRGHIDSCLTASFPNSKSLA